MTKTPEKPLYSEPTTIISVSAKDRNLVDVWEVAVNKETNIHEGFKLAGNITRELADELCQKRGGEIKVLDSAFEM